MSSPHNKYLLVDFAFPVKFTFDGEEFTGYQGDTIASALYRAGVRVFSRGFKYHRPRGLMTLDGSSPNDLVEVNGTPNVHAGTMQLEANMKVRGQNAWPSVRLDLMGIIDKLSAFLPVGFYYKTFIRPRTLWPLYEKVLRNAAGLGKIDPDPDKIEEPHFDKVYAHADVTVVGGGPGGMSAALAAADLGAQVILIEREPRLGGHLSISEFEISNADWDFFQHSAFRNIDSSYNLVENLTSALHAHPNISVLASATAFGWYQGNYIGVGQRQRLIKLRTHQLIVATGRIEQPLVFQNNDLPGVFLGDGLQRLMNLYSVRPGKRAVVVTTNDQGWQVARDLLSHEVEVAMVLDSRPEIIENTISGQVRDAGVPVLSGATILKALGRKSVGGVVLTQIDRDGLPVPGTVTTLKCDLIGVSGGFAANNALLYQSGCKIAYDPAIDDFVPQVYPPGVKAAGHAAGTCGLEAILLEGQVAGLEAASRAGYGDLEVNLSSLKERLKSAKRTAYALMPNHPLVYVPSDGDKQFVCFCEDVTAKDLHASAAEGFDDIQTLKRYSTISMGPTQGKLCTANAIKLLARDTERAIAESGSTTSRPPFTPVKLGLLAGRKLEPVRRTPMHHLHILSGATLMDAGLWKRPEHYGNPEAEVRSVREQVGIIDVSTLGKIDVRGPEAMKFLERIYTGRLAELKPGHLRYGLMCTEEGIILDDGVVSRFAEDRFYLTTTSGGAGSVYEWLTWWATAWNFKVHITDQTAAYAAVNVAGPRTRELLSHLTEIDLSNEAFPYLHMRQGLMAGVPARLMRIGFVGELGYEIHVPAEYGIHLWNTIMEAGTEYGISPFGVEAQRVLRLEKGHIIIGQDTDALSDPYNSGMGWAVKLDKFDFIGKPSLTCKKEKTPGEKLVGFEMEDSTIVPYEGEQFLQDGHLVGRVTSARSSFNLDKSIGLGWVKSEYAALGSILTVRTNGHLAQARLVKAPFYDPAGERLKG